MNDAVLRLLYGNAVGRWFLCIMLRLGLPKLMAVYLNSRLSKRLIPRFIKRNGISMGEYPPRKYESFADFFARAKDADRTDPEPTHFTSPCDGWLTAYPICEDSSFQIKGSRYRVRDLVNDSSYAEAYNGGLCLIFRLTSADCHRYGFPDDGFVREHHHLEGTLHSVQPIACETLPVYRLNRRCWTVLETEHFGDVIQVEVGALVVGGIINEKENTMFRKGEEMGHFTLCGSTIVLLVQKDRLELLPEINSINGEGREYRVSRGEWIGTRTGTEGSTKVQ